MLISVYAAQFYNILLSISDEARAFHYIYDKFRIKCAEKLHISLFMLVGANDFFLLLCVNTEMGTK